MNLKKFERRFHELHSEYSRKYSDTKRELELKLAHELAIISAQNNDEMFDEIGALFKNMEFEHKLEFMESYVHRARLAKYIEPHEISAMKLIDWPYADQLTSKEPT